MSLLEHLTKLALENKKELHDHHRLSLVSYFFVKDDEVYFADNQACYYQMEYGVPWSSGITGIVTSLAFNRNVKDRDIIQEWIKFHVEDKVFGQAILSKDISWIMENELIIADTTAPGNLMFGVLTSIRQIWEYPQIVNSYYYMVKGGVNPWLAYNLSHFLRHDANSYSLSSYAPGHNLFNYYNITPRHLTNWLAGEMEHKRDPYIKHSKYSGASNMFDKNNSHISKDSEKTLDRFRGFCHKAGITGKDSNNPFTKNKLITSWATDVLNKHIKDNEDALIKELCNA